ncbi:MAG: hypothetical protein HY077_16380 [Elusimicrobia bacterium]|nr:hypothetical protein [Elusimicrobiota bacterium]
MELRSYSYEELVGLCRSGSYPSCAARAASGRLNHLLGLDRERLAVLKAEAARRRVGLVVLGSRVSGPRSRQRALHPALMHCLPLTADRRAPAALYPGAEGVAIDKTSIKDFGVNDPRSSDLSLILVDARRADGELEALARELELDLNSRGWGFPVRVFARLHGRTFRSEGEFLKVNGEYLRSLSSEVLDEKAVRAASRELYMTLNLPRRFLTWDDLRNGLLTAGMGCVALTAALGFRWAVPAVAFVFGLFGRYLARLRAGVAFGLGNGFAGNAAAMGMDALIGISAMAGLINPLAHFGLPFSKIVAASVSHTLARGGLRLFLDKRFSTGDEKRQAHGVIITMSLNCLQGMATSFYYTGAVWANFLQWVLAGGGIILIFGPSVKAAWERFSAVERPDVLPVES